MLRFNKKKDVVLVRDLGLGTFMCLGACANQKNINQTLYQNEQSI
ncbi:MAG: hypothetical protein ACPGC9_02020 [Cytophagales bacterium]